MDNEKLDGLQERLDNAISRLQAVAQGRQYVVGTKIKFKEKYGVVTHLNQGSEDPNASTVDLRLDDGTTVEGVSVTTVALEFYKA